MALGLNSIVSAHRDGRRIRAGNIMKYMSRDSGTWRGHEGKQVNNPVMDSMRTEL